MKYLLSFFLLLFCLRAVLAQDTIRLPRSANNAVYVADASKSIPPGSVVELQGDYLFYKVYNVKGTAEKPITFINKGLVRIGGFKAYTFQVQGEHFIINGSGDPAYKYGFLLNYDTTVAGVFGFNPENSTDFEVHHIECTNAAEGIFQNPRTGGLMNNIFYHHIYIHDLRNPYTNPPGWSEGFYLGNTSDTIPYTAAYRFKNCRIEDCYMENIPGDGIQVEQGSFIVKRDTVINFATAQIPQQNNGIQVGPNGSAIIDSVTIYKGGGKGIIILGTDSVVLTNSTFTNIYLDTIPFEDVVYINGKGSVPLNVRFENNIFSGCSGRFGINNATNTANTSGSVFINNYINGTFSIQPYKIVYAKDQWIYSTLATDNRYTKMPLLAKSYKDLKMIYKL